MEAKKREECLEELLKEKQQICEQLEVEMVQLRDELKSKRVQEKFENNSTVLDSILKSQRNYLLKQVWVMSKKETMDFQTSSKITLSLMLKPFLKNQ